jgi:predicted nucleotidyltransferase
MLTPALQDSLHAMLTWFLEPRSATLDLEGEHRPAAIAAHLATAYEALPVRPADGELVVKTPPHWSAADYRARDDFGGRVIAICEYIATELAPFLTTAYLHGSLATRDYAIGWSDVDTLLVIRRDVVRDRRALVELRRRCLAAWPLLLRVCPLQHHGFIIATEDDLESYPSHYLPPAVLDAAAALLPQPTTSFRLRPSASGAVQGLCERRDALRHAVAEGVLKHHPRNGVYLLSRYRNADDAMLQLFSLLGYLMTVPAYVLDACGKPSPKRESFARARQYFSDDAWMTITRASAVRSQWPDREGVTYSGNAIPAWLRQTLGECYFEDALRLLDEAVNAIGAAQPTS